MKLRQWRRPDVFIVIFEHISHLVLVLLLLTLKMKLPAGYKFTKCAEIHSKISVFAFHSHLQFFSQH